MSRARPPAWLVQGLLAALVVAAACAPAAIARVGSPAPDFTLPSVGGPPVRLADLKGRPVFVNFWATWCTPCREEMPAMQALYERYRDQGLVILAVNMEEDEARVRRWIEQGGYTFTFLLDSDGQLVKRYNVHAAPTSYFIGPDSVIRDLKLGAISSAEMEAKVRSLLGLSQ